MFSVSLRPSRQRRPHSVSRHLGGVSSLALMGVVAASAFSANVAPAQAQEELGVIEEIVVTAQFREQQLQNTPVAITAITGDTLEARSQTSVDQIQYQSPNVTLKPQGQAFGPSMGASIRGVGQFDFNPALEPGVGIYIDDVYYGTLTGSAFDLLDIQRVEVLRGPQGILAGKNSIGGAIKVYSKQPGDGDSQVSATYGSRDRLDFRGTADFNITDNLAARITGVSKKQDGYIDRIDYGCANPDSAIPADLGSETDCVVAKESETDTNAARAMLSWTPDPDVEVTLIGDYTHDDSTQTGNVLLFADYPSNPFVDNDINPYDADIAYDDRFVPDEKHPYYNYGSYISLADDVNGEAPGGQLPTTRADGRSDYEGWGVSGHIDWDLTDAMTLTSITAYRAHTTAFSNDDDASPLAHSLGRGTIDFWQVTQEVRLNGAVGPNNDVEYTLGGFYMDERTTYATFQDLRYAGLPPFQGDDPVNADNKSVFGHLSWYATERLTLLGGLRYTDEHKDYTYTRLNRDGTPHVALGALDGETGIYDGDRVDYRAAIQYQWTDTVMTYAQTSTGFKGGGVNPRPFSVGQVRPFDKETLTSYEIGLKSDLFQRRARVNVAAFYSDYSDIQLTPNTCPELVPPVPCALPKNLGDAEMKGVEVELDVQPVERLSIDGSVSYIDFDYTSLDTTVGVTQNDVAPNTPEWKWSAGVQYRIDLPNMGALIPRFDASYQDTIYTGEVNRDLNKIEDYILANARLTWIGPDRNWEAALSVTNVFDKYYMLTKFDLTGAAAGFVTGQPGAPREWALTVKRRF